MLVPQLQDTHPHLTEAARMLGVARHTLSRILNGHTGISAEMAIRLEKVGWSNADFWMRRQAAYVAGGARLRAVLGHADFWMRRQAAYDLAVARLREDRIVVERQETAVPASAPL